jgi:hypothetical protein
MNLGMGFRPTLKMDLEANPVEKFVSLRTNPKNVRELVRILKQGDLDIIAKDWDRHYLHSEIDESGIACYADDKTICNAFTVDYHDPHRPKIKWSLKRKEGKVENLTQAQRAGLFLGVSLAGAMKIFVGKGNIGKRLVDEFFNYIDKQSTGVVEENSIRELYTNQLEGHLQGDCQDSLFIDGERRLVLLPSRKNVNLHTIEKMEKKIETYYGRVEPIDMKTILDSTVAGYLIKNERAFKKAVRKYPSK